jgi:hypothetical protein
MATHIFIKQLPTTKLLFKKTMSGAYWLTEMPYLASVKTTILNPEINYAFDWSSISYIMGLITLLLTIGIS